MPFELKELTDADGEGVFEGYGSVFGNKDHGHDIIAPGAFKRALAEARKMKRLPRMLWQHRSEDPIGVWTAVQETEMGG